MKDTKKNKSSNNNKPKNDNNKTKKNVKSCMEKFAEKKVKYWTSDFNKPIQKLEKKNLTKEEQKLLIKLKKQKKNQINNLKKQYKLYNCNINCQNTLLEPGLPNKIPKSMQKEYNYSNKLIKIFNNQRKKIFGNKENVLIDNFYENTPEKMKKQLLNEGAISQCLPIQSGGSFIMKDGHINKSNETYKGNPFFRKVFYYSNPSTENQIRAANAEYTICNILINNPFPNIVTIYEVNKDYIEMEELITNIKLDQTILIETMTNVKNFLQSLGIMYIDWKKDNIGVNKDGIYKLFDFDVSGLLDLQTNQWIVEPLNYWNFNKALENGCKTPKQIDDYSFNYGLLGIKKENCNL